MAAVGEVDDNFSFDNFSGFDILTVGREKPN